MIHAGKWLHVQKSFPALPAKCTVPESEIIKKLQNCAQCKSETVEFWRKRASGADHVQTVDSWKHLCRFWYGGIVTELQMHLTVTAGQSGLRTLIIIMTYIYRALINALSAHMIHINLNMIFYAHVEHRPTKTIYIKCYTEKANRPTKTIYIKCYTEKANGHMRYTHTHTVTLRIW